MAARNYGQYSGMTTALELVGERWALLIVRDLLVGPRRYTDLKAGLPRIPTNILSTRLRELQESGVLARAPLHHSVVYVLTDLGRQLEPIVLALGRWGLQVTNDPAEGDVITADSLTMDLYSAFRTDAASTLAATTYRLHVGDVDLAVSVDGATVHIAPWSSATAELELEVTPSIRSLIAGEVSPESAREQGIVRIAAGNPELLARFAATFSLASVAVPF
ncbi:winged helix-turn-helix transcriptional regulator [Mycetocola zhadangensis]|uniref:Transcriptional regulator n=1 Tax=Mycetocola zhadangensis TaxID=1164595 RepID=A0A3L7IS25_9MICO|nr:winged helix-turn-helix transcriptional regulator [Mycetocola zhadangensis]RLQ81004.1 transcriptional regulator [Mycetocola zhadangensis]GGF03916.1 HxlR family transcriptional regulator [Mycetocola zhadangensis]